MSKVIIIQEGGIGKQLTTDKLKTNLVGGGSCLWVPEDGINLGTKSISENGTYRASDDGYTGYSEVTVSGVGTASGKAPDGSGDDAAAYTDPETGDLVITKLPSSIEVITPPTNPYGIYTDGQAISTDGMVVKAYLKSGDEYGVVPNGEITLNPSVAQYDSSTDRADMYNYGDIHAVHVTSGSTPINPQAVNKQYQCTGINAKTDKPNLSFFLTKYNTTIYVAADNAIQTSITFVDDGVSTAIRYSGSGRFVSGINGSGINSVPVSTSDPTNTDISDLEPERAGSHQTINVSWPRPHDGKVLETTFEILVAPGYGGDEGENGNAGTPPPGMVIP